ncbi:MAG: D-alanyl-D-alanine carboxypeptidase [Azospirillaceae bacterium]|nr:D-alanyl-D-alanine carboxypeptidase [Azospirillaceae bacterium]
MTLHRQGAALFSAAAQGIPSPDTAAPSRYDHEPRPDHGRGAIHVLATMTLAILLVATGFATSRAQAAALRYGAIVIDAASGAMLHAEDPDARIYPASLTKLMTLFLTFDALSKGRLRMNQPLTVSEHAAAQSPSKLGLRPGQTILVEQAILGIVTRSANDAAVVLGEHLGGNEANFATMMTARAHAMGMGRTVFRNASGLPNNEQVTTPRDIATLARALIFDHPSYYHYFSRRSFVFNGQLISTHNHLMSRYAGMDGLKTGFINAAGFNLAASAVRNGRRLICVVLGGQNRIWRDNRVAALLDAGFSQQPARATPISRTSNDSDDGDDDEAQPAAIQNSSGPNSDGSAATPASFAGTDSGSMDALAAKVGTEDGAAQRLPPRLIGSAAAAAAPAWAIQIGAYNDRTLGQLALSQATQRLPKLLGKAKPQMIEVHSGQSTIYRARLIGINENYAKAACEKLERAGHRCLPIPPETSSQG